MNHTIDIHIFLSTLAFLALCAAAILAVLLAVQDYVLRHQPALKFMVYLPPLQRMESWLFRAVGLGFFLLTVVLLTSMWFFHLILTTPLWRKALISLFAWIVLAVLLAGRHYFGWRGRQAIRWTLTGVFLVALVYFSSEVL
jgi:ABC-type uncharacterized transport system permease subunit